ncbi:hypothetical protein GCM10011504_56050 [Siccirubricoccus deserti]|uniref:DUF5681 domain-containing protein n=1 Tax=Siccirubricoccus deserti TaxID=2013562 RepID=A0A9X0R3Q6_9PROT|nr:DUF5681 domain-containing protein [Siccirubricoccus deserti]MBC4019051.1 hypothetical protein [Siccirubricoccus deserti]GGC71088.1 hypothetical protein GCM10011504_56050 [Siccirubricoccus deserti]
MARGKGDGNYKVGYGRPPEHTRFRKGQSGNPKGRPKGAQDLGSIFQRLLGEVVNVREGERSRTMTKGEAMLQALMARALRGDARAMGQAIALAREQGLLAPPADGASARSGAMLVVPGMATDPEEWERSVQEHMRRQGLLPEDPSGES